MEDNQSEELRQQQAQIQQQQMAWMMYQMQLLQWQAAQLQAQTLPQPPQPENQAPAAPEPATEEPVPQVPEPPQPPSVVWKAVKTMAKFLIFFWFASQGAGWDKIGHHIGGFRNVATLIVILVSIYYLVTNQTIAVRAAQRPEPVQQGERTILQTTLLLVTTFFQSCMPSWRIEQLRT
eukprot:TRINITY_DN93344_c0_g1_i1.p1 TRINITY_DN93344_c0_g1~~TRINITY_DN93344_c0_g1_i1.p1  ORF type:complete len:178 (-),score=35.20 TRINITY_DN93344_c0_g1_i1:20-553(-)